jgi:hypothetical protein
MNAVPLGSQNTVEFTASLPFSQHSRLFDLPTEDDELLPEENVFCHELGLASGKVSHRTQHERGIRRFGPVDEAAVERLKTHVCQALDEGDNRLHSIRFLY